MVDDEDVRQLVREEFMKRHARRTVGPCRSCGGGRFFGQAGQGAIGKMDVYACRTCGQIELFARNPEQFNEGVAIDLAPTGPYR